MLIGVVVLVIRFVYYVCGCSFLLLCEDVLVNCNNVSYSYTVFYMVLL